MSDWAIAFVLIGLTSVEYINQHPYCLHLWRRKDTNNYCDYPPQMLVGF